MSGPASRGVVTGPRVSRVWVGRAVAALAAAAVVNVALSAMRIEHDAPLVALLAATTLAAGALALEAIDASSRLPWTIVAPRCAPRPG